MVFEAAFAIESDTHYLPLLRQWPRAIAKACGRSLFPRNAIFPVTLALVEAVDNAIFHAHKCNRKSTIGISARLDGKKICMRVKDEGKGFCGLGSSTPVQGFVDHGRGLFIIKQIMSSVRSEVLPGGHVLKMAYNI